MSAASARNSPTVPAHPRRWRAIVAAAGLPDPIASLVRRTVRRAGGWFRLWPSERADIARELVAHFRDGIAAANSPEQLASAFGNPEVAAKLMARAKRRARPFWARTLSRALRASATVLLLLFAAYAYLGARFYLARPNVTRNYAAELNRGVLATPAQQRAWPLFIEAVRAFGPDPEPVRDAGWPEAPSDPHWFTAVAHLRAHPEALALIRRAAAAPALGYVYRGSSDPEFLRALESRSPEIKYTPEPQSEVENPMLVGVLLPHLGELRRAARLLRIDAVDAASAGDRERFLGNLEAMISLAGQAWAEPMFISQLVGLGVASLACDVTRGYALTPGLLHDDDLSRLAHRLGDFAGRPVRFNFSSERMIYDDFLQRFFTDDGHGDGVLVYQQMPQTFRDFGTPDPSSKLIVRAALPVLAAATFTRADLARQVEVTLAACERDQTLPLARRSERTSDAEHARLLGMTERTFPMFASLSGGNGPGANFLARDLFEVRRDATLATLAIENYRRLHNRFPQSLGDLVPQYLPRVPIDAADGLPLRYTLSTSGPTLYSIGADGDDDGGHPPVKGNKQATRFDPGVASPDSPVKETDPEVLADIDGDWILFPALPDAPTAHH